MHRFRALSDSLFACRAVTRLFEQINDSLRRGLHPGDGAEARAHVLEAGAHEIYPVIDDEETVVVPAGELDEVMLLDVEDTLNHLRLLIHYLRYSGKCPHDADVNPYCCF